MKLLIYSNHTDCVLERLMQAIASFKDNSQVFTSIERLSEYLCHPNFYTFTGIFIARELNDLKRLLSIEEYFLGNRIILILPPDNEETLKAGVKLYPRYIESIHSDFDNINAILNKLDSYMS